MGDRRSVSPFSPSPSGTSPIDMDLPPMGSRVTLQSGLQGLVRFIGPTGFASGLWIGIELSQPVGKNDGSIGGKRYFQCSPAFGIFVRQAQITSVNGESTDIDAMNVPRLSAASPSSTSRIPSPTNIGRPSQRRLTASTHPSITPPSTSSSAIKKTALALSAFTSRPPTSAAVRSTSNTKSPRTNEDSSNPLSRAPETAEMVNSHPAATLRKSLASPTGTKTSLLRQKVRVAASIVSRIRSPSPSNAASQAFVVPEVTASAPNLSFTENDPLVQADISAESPASQLPIEETLLKRAKLRSASVDRSRSTLEDQLAKRRDSSPSRLPLPAQLNSVASPTPVLEEADEERISRTPARLRQPSLRVSTSPSRSRLEKDELETNTMSKVLMAFGGKKPKQDTSFLVSATEKQEEGGQHVVEHELHNLRDQYKTLQTQHNADLHELHEARERIEALQRAHEGAIEENLGLQKEWEAEKLGWNQLRSTYQGDLKDLEATLVRERAKVAEVESKLHHAQSLVTKLEEEKSELVKTCDEALSHMDTAVKLKDENQKLRKELEESMAALERSPNLKASLTTSNDDLIPKSTYDELKCQFDDMEKDWEERLRDLEQEYTKLMTRNKELETSRLHGDESQANQPILSEGENSNEMKALRDGIQELQQELDVIKAERQASFKIGADFLFSLTSQIPPSTSLSDLMNTIKSTHESILLSTNNTHLSHIQDLEAALSSVQAQLQSCQRSIEEKSALSEKLSLNMEQLQVALETAVVDKEISEQKLEVLTQEHEKLLEKLKASDFEIQILKEEQQLTREMHEETLKSLSDKESKLTEIVQIKSQNEQLTAALLKLRHITKAQEQQFKQSLEKTLNQGQSGSKVLGRKSKSNQESDREKAVVASSPELSRAQTLIHELKTRLDEFHLSEQIIHRLSDKNLELEDRLGLIQNTLVELEELNRMNNEMERLRNDREKELLFELDGKERLISELGRRLMMQTDTIADYESTLVKYRGMLASNEGDSRSSHFAESKPVGGQGESRELVNLNMQLQSAELKAHTRRIEVELSKWDKKELELTLELFKKYLPDTFEVDQEFVSAHLLLQRLKFKLQILMSYTREQLGSLDDLTSSEAPENPLATSADQQKRRQEHILASDLNKMACLKGLYMLFSKFDLWDTFLSCPHAWFSSSFEGDWDIEDVWELIHVPLMKLYQSLIPFESALQSWIKNSQAHNVDWKELFVWIQDRNEWAISLESSAQTFMNEGMDQDSTDPLSVSEECSLLDLSLNIVATRSVFTRVDATSRGTIVKLSDKNFHSSPLLLLFTPPPETQDQLVQQIVTFWIMETTVWKMTWANLIRKLMSSVELVPDVSENSRFEAIALVRTLDSHGSIRLRDISMILSSIQSSIHSTAKTGLDAQDRESLLTCFVPCKELEDSLHTIQTSIEAWSPADETSLKSTIQSFSKLLPLPQESKESTVNAVTEEIRGNGFMASLETFLTTLSSIKDSLELFRSKAESASSRKTLSLPPVNKISEGKSSTIWDIRGEHVKAEFSLNKENAQHLEEMKEKLDALKDEKTSLEEKLSEAAAKIDILSTRQQNSVRYSDQEKSLKQELSHYKEQYQIYANAVESLHADLEQAENENEELKKKLWQLGRTHISPVKEKSKNALSVSPVSSSRMSQQQAYTVPRESQIREGEESSQEQVLLLLDTIHYLARVNSRLQYRLYHNNVASMVPLPRLPLHHRSQWKATLAFCSVSAPRIISL